jgi:hypothetical protein
MKYIKFFFLSLVALLTMSCDKGPDLELTVQRFPEAAFYSGELTQLVGQEQSTLPAHVEMNRLDNGGYSLSIAADNPGIEDDHQYILFKEIDGEMLCDTLKFEHENIVGKFNLTECTFASLDAELSKDRAKVTLDFGNDKVWTCDIESEEIKLE